jgi:hypothetical protein
LPFFNNSKRSTAAKPKLSASSQPSHSITSPLSGHANALTLQTDLASDDAEHELYPETLTNTTLNPNFSDIRQPGMDSHDLNWEQFTLVAKEDIFYTQEDVPVLLMKAGQGVDIHQVAKLIKFGVQPEQFILSEDPTSTLPHNIFEAITDSLSKDAEITSDGLPGKPLYFQKGAKDKILILDSDERSIKRLSDCLKGYGIPLVNLHPLTNSQHLFWAVERYEPHILFIDFNPYLQNKSQLASLPETMMTLKSYPFIREVVLTAFLRPDQEEVRQDLQNLAKYYGAKVLLKPVNRFALSDVLSLPGQRK